MPRSARRAARAMSSLKYVLPPSITTSPGDSTSASVETTASVAAPAGTMDHTARGASSAPASPERSSTARAPASTSGAAEDGSRSYTTTSWPAASRRRAMLAPMRPSPIIAICIIMSLRISEGDGHHRVEGREAALDVVQVHAQRATPAVRQHAEVAARLRRLHHAERVAPAGHGQIDGIVAGHLQEHPGVRAALVGLAGGVEEARAEAEARGHAPRVAHAVPHGLQQRLMRVGHVDIGEQREVVAGAGALEMTREHGLDARRLAERGGVGGI